MLFIVCASIFDIVIGLAADVAPCVLQMYSYVITFCLQENVPQIIYWAISNKN